MPDIHLEDQILTLFAGLVLFQPLVKRLDLNPQPTHCFRRLKDSPMFGRGLITLTWMVHLLIGYWRLQDLLYHQNDPMVRRPFEISRLPDEATVSRTLAGMDSRGVDNVRKLNQQLVMDRLSLLGVARITLDFDAWVIATGRFTEGTAVVGFNRKKKSQRSSYPLFCTLARQVRGRC